MSEWGGQFDKVVIATSEFEDIIKEKLVNEYGIDEKRIEGCFSGILRNGKPCGASQTVALPFDKIVKVQLFVQAGIDVQRAYTRNDERIDNLPPLFVFIHGIRQHRRQGGLVLADTGRGMR